VSAARARALSLSLSLSLLSPSSTSSLAPSGHLSVSVRPFASVLTVNAQSRVACLDALVTAGVLAPWSTLLSRRHPAFSEMCTALFDDPTRTVTTSMAFRALVYCHAMALTPFLQLWERELPQPRAEFSGPLASFSVIMPCYRCGARTDRLSKTLLSVLAAVRYLHGKCESVPQLVNHPKPRGELVLVDDGSGDER
jgi:hypothetical protein